MYRHLMTTLVCPRTVEAIEAKLNQFISFNKLDLNLVSLLSIYKNKFYTYEYTLNGSKFSDSVSVGKEHLTTVLVSEEINTKELAQFILNEIEHHELNEAYNCEIFLELITKVKRK